MLPFSEAGCMASGCNTVAPKKASSVASSNVRRGTGAAPSTMRGSLVSTPSTSFHTCRGACAEGGWSVAAYRLAGLAVKSKGGTGAHMATPAPALAGVKTTLPRTSPRSRTHLHLRQVEGCAQQGAGQVAAAAAECGDGPRLQPLAQEAGHHHHLALLAGLEGQRLLERRQRQLIVHLCQGEGGRGAAAGEGKGVEPGFGTTRPAKPDRRAWLAPWHGRQAASRGSLARLVHPTHSTSPLLSPPGYLHS